MRNLSLLGCALSVCLTLPACSSSSDTPASGDAGSNGEAGSNADAGSNSGDAGSSGEGGSAGSVDVADLAQWPMPNAPGTGLPNPQHYDATSTPGVVHDLVTGLDWLQNPGDALYSRADAITHCDALSFAGFEDWRAPAFIELASLFDAVPDNADPNEPLYISTVFSIGARYWSTTPPVGTDTTLGRLLDFSAADCGAPTSALCAIGVAGKKAVALGGAFCVRSSAASVTGRRFDIHSDHVTDTYTGLNWITLPAAIQTGTYDDAVTRCDALGDSARLPSVNELLSLLVPSLDSEAFPEWPHSLFGWTSSAIAVKAGSYWGVATGGASEPFAATAFNRIECVR